MKSIRGTSGNLLIAFTRFCLGLIFILSGVTKVTMPLIAESWIILIEESKIPLNGFCVSFIPFIEIVLGFILLIGFFTRIGSFIMLIMLLIALFINFTLTSSELSFYIFKEPFLATMIFLMILTLLIRGGGFLSLDYMKVSQ